MKTTFATLAAVMMLMTAWGTAGAVCEDFDMYCWGPGETARVFCGGVKVPACVASRGRLGHCWPCEWGMSSGGALTSPGCVSYVSQCNSQFTACCKGNCFTTARDFFVSGACSSEAGVWNPPYWPQP